MKSRIISWLLLGIMCTTPLLFSGCFKEGGLKYKMTLEVWGIFDDSDAFDELNGQYTRLNRQISQIKYKKISSDVSSYERELFDAIAAGNGPDVFFIHNTWLTRDQNKMAPLPNSEQYITEYKNNFVDVAMQDFVEDQQIYAMPLYCDTLGLYYNKDLLNQAGITAPPTTWQEVLDQTKILTKIDEFGNINQSAIALGRGSSPGSINRASDILMLMMMQGGATMIDGKAKKVNFDRSSSALANPGANSLEFYTQFSNGSAEAYTWNAKMDYSIDSFRYGKTAMMINYAYWIDRLHKSDPKLNFDVAPVPQLSPTAHVDFANYWGLGVVRHKELVSSDPNNTITYTNDDRIKEAWNYIRYVTTQPQAAKGAEGLSIDPMANYLARTGKPAARRDLIEAQKSNDSLDVFAWQALTAKSWRQPDATAVEDIFIGMIDEVVNGNATVGEAIRTGATRVNALIQ